MVRGPAFISIPWIPSTRTSCLALSSPSLGTDADADLFAAAALFLVDWVGLMYLAVKEEAEEADVVALLRLRRTGVSMLPAGCESLGPEAIFWS